MKPTTKIRIKWIAIALIIYLVVWTMITNFTGYDNMILSISVALVISSITGKKLQGEIYYEQMEKMD